MSSWQWLSWKLEIFAILDDNAGRLVSLPPQTQTYVFGHVHGGHQDEPSVLSTHESWGKAVFFSRLIRADPSDVLMYRPGSEHD